MNVNSHRHTGFRQWLAVLKKFEKHKPYNPEYKRPEYKPPKYKQPPNISPPTHWHEVPSESNPPLRIRL